MIFALDPDSFDVQVTSGIVTIAGRVENGAVSYTKIADATKQHSRHAARR